MREVPKATPVTTPEPDATVAMAALLLTQVPPDAASVRLVLVPTHTLVLPVIAVGVRLTVTVVVVLHPVDNAYVIVAVPAPAPFTIPVLEPTVATNVLLLLQVPPTVASVKADEVPVQMPVLPAMPAGRLLTVTTVVVVQPAGNI